MIKRIYKKHVEPILAFLGYIFTIKEIVKYAKYPVEQLYALLIKLDLEFLVSVVLIVGFITFILSFVIWISKVKKPQKSLSLLVVPYLLPKEDWIETENDYNRNLMSYNFMKFGQIIVIIGLAMTLSIRLILK